MRTEPMAIYHLRAKIISRSKGQSTVAGAAYRSGGHSATHAAAYRAGERLTDQRTGRTFDYGRKQGIVHTEIIAPKNGPEWVYSRSSLGKFQQRSVFSHRNLDNSMFSVAYVCEKKCIFDQLFEK